ncbi:hypothetical protein [Costertonia aggregata]|uniref:Uncharacterized protein n=1 Tax=Costertonia aggregata TaxID=343403 RepID=A0A7H9ATC9_9FLAO|nr:hypothetical protein [Costertonia aggregata]QLG46676.1 hypothetical protein HYG79_15400 [Costertonia aggregata]
MRFLVLLFFTLSISCKTQSAKNTKYDSSRYAPNMILQDNYSGSETSENVVIRNNKELHGFFAQVNKTRKPGIPVPTIDFTKEMVVAICSGKVDGNVMPKLSWVKEDDETITFNVAKEPLNKADVTSSTSPFRLYKIPLTAKTISFK